MVDNSTPTEALDSPNAFKKFMLQGIESGWIDITYSIEILTDLLRLVWSDQGLVIQLVEQQEHWLSSDEIDAIMETLTREFEEKSNVK